MSSSSEIPRPALIYGLLGLIPFLALPLLVLAIPAQGEAWLNLLSFYGALILSFLGGARWGLAIDRPVPSALTLSLSMLPTLTAFAVLGLLPGQLDLQLGVLFISLILQGIWDIRSHGLPSWYPRLRTILTLVAALGLALGTGLAHG